MKLSFLPLPKRKIPAVLAMAFSLVSLGFFIAAVVSCVSFGFSGDDATLMLLTESIWAAMPALVFYLADAVIAVIRGCQRRSNVFHSVMAVVIFGSVILFAFYIVALRKNLWDVNSLVIIWNLYLTAMVALESVSIVKLL